MEFVLLIACGVVLGLIAFKLLAVVFDNFLERRSKRSAARAEKKRSEERLLDLSRHLKREKRKWYAAHPEIEQRHRLEKLRLHGTITVLVLVALVGFYVIVAGDLDGYPWASTGLFFLLVGILMGILHFWPDLAEKLQAKQDSEVDVSLDDYRGF